MQARHGERRNVERRVGARGQVEAARITGASKRRHHHRVGRKRRQTLRDGSGRLEERADDGGDVDGNGLAGRRGLQPDAEEDDVFLCEESALGAKRRHTEHRRSGSAKNKGSKFEASLVKGTQDLYQRKPCLDQQQQTATN